MSLNIITSSSKIKIYQGTCGYSPKQLTIHSFPLRNGVIIKVTTTGYDMYVGHDYSVSKTTGYKVERRGWRKEVFFEIDDPSKIWIMGDVIFPDMGVNFTWIAF